MKKPGHIFPIWRMVVMKVTRKQLIERIAMMETKLQCHQARATFHKNRLNRLFGKSHILYIAMLLPAFFWGWKQGRTAKIWGTVRALLDYSLMIVFSFIKKTIKKTLLLAI